MSPPVTVVAAGVDSLYLGYEGELRFGVDRELAQLQLAAKRSRLTPKDPVTGEALLRVDDSPFDLGPISFQVSPRGGQTSPYLLLHGDVQVAISPEGTPTVMVRPRAEALWRDGLARTVIVADAIAAAALREVKDRWVNRIDIAVDHQGFVPTLGVLDKFSKPGGLTVKSFPTDLGDPDAFKDESLELEQFWHRYALTGFRFGRAGPLVGRWYDKTEEIQVSHKPWFRDIWSRSAGYVEGAPVWRLESQARREFLRGMRDAHGARCQTVEDVLRTVPEQWRAFTQRRLRLTLGDGSTFVTARGDEKARADRSTIDPRWEALATTDALKGVCDRNGMVSSHEIIKSELGVLAPGARGYLASIAAIMKEPKFEDGALAAIGFIQKFSEEQGIDPDAVVKRARDKRTRARERDDRLDAQAAQWRQRQRERVCEMRVRVRWSHPTQLAFTWPSQMAFRWSTAA